ncbi:MAG: oligoribonuclease [Bifidobacteriaceae bacterium]|jgi:oligoribonuclease|nr:oligoribonuclease [Bifidobacteriaceae bacterium]
MKENDLKKEALEKPVLLWVDLEMTGLDPKIDKILEIAAIVTNWKLEKIATYQAAQKVDENLVKQRMVGPFWDGVSATRDKLISQNKSAKKGASEIEKELLDFVEKHFGSTIPILAGNSIHQDRLFIAKEWKKLNKKLHYRMLDVSSLKLVFENLYSIQFIKKKTHRAIDDIIESIGELKFYLKEIR